MKIKVCGMRDVENIQSLLALKPEYVGFIFYKKSKRFVTNFPEIPFPKGIKKVGVFVNETIDEVVKIVKKYNLDAVQLHGNESPEYCKLLKTTFAERSRSGSKQFQNGILTSLNNQIEIFKAFSVDEEFDFSSTNVYQDYCDYFLFDTKGKDFGGNGIKFNWEILQKYKGETPFLLSGGISKKDTPNIMSFLQRLESKLCIGIDINSGFELEPALKNIKEIKEFKNNLI